MSYISYTFCSFVSCQGSNVPSQLRDLRPKVASRVESQVENCSTSLLSASHDSGHHRLYQSPARTNKSPLDGGHSRPKFKQRQSLYPEIYKTTETKIKLDTQREIKHDLSVSSMRLISRRHLSAIFHHQDVRLSIDKSCD